MSGRCFSHVLILTWLGTVRVLHRARNRSRNRNRILRRVQPLLALWAAIEYEYEYRPPGRTEYEYELGVCGGGIFGRLDLRLGGGDLPPHPRPLSRISRGRGEELVTSGLTADS